MVPLRPLLAAGALLATAVALPASARVPRLVELTEHTVVTAAHSGYVDVIVPVDARLSPKVASNPDVTLDGSGRYVGFWLERLDDTQMTVDGLSATRLPAFLGGKQETYGSYTPTSECTGTPEAYPVHWDCTHIKPPSAILLHEGRYRLVVLTDGSPLSVDLTLHGLDDGTTDVQPTRALASAEKALPVQDTVGDTLVTFGTTAPVSGNVLGTVMFTARGTASPVLEGRSACARADEGDAPPFAYSSECPDGTGGSYQYTVDAGGVSEGLWGGFVTASSDPSTGAVGLGGSVSDSGGVTLGSTLGVWLQMPPS